MRTIKRHWLYNFNPLILVIKIAIGGMLNTRRSSFKKGLARWSIYTQLGFDFYCIDLYILYLL